MGAGPGGNGIAFGISSCRIGIERRMFGEFAQMIVSAWAPTRTLAESIGDQITEALRIAGNQVTNRAGSYDEETGFFAVTIDTTWFIAA